LHAQREKLTKLLYPNGYMASSPVEEAKAEAGEEGGKE
jgi:hypothetical protein